MREAPPDRYVAYTCVTGGYDRLLQSPFAGNVSEMDLVCFCDEKRQAWPSSMTLPLASPPRLQSGHDVNRYHKVYPHRLLSAYRYSIYLDGNIRYEGDPRELIDTLEASGASVGIFRHPGGRTLEEEVLACEEHKKFDRFDRARVDKQIEHYKQEGFDIGAVIGANYLMVRDHMAPALPTAMALWWSQLFEFSKRDQLSLLYSLWKAGVCWIFLDEDGGLPPERVIRTGHYRSPWRRVRERVRTLYMR